MRALPFLCSISKNRSTSARGQPAFGREVTRARLKPGHLQAYRGSDRDRGVERGLERAKVVGEEVMTMSCAI